MTPLATGAGLAQDVGVRAMAVVIAERRVDETLAALREMIALGGEHGAAVLAKWLVRMAREAEDARTAFGVATAPSKEVPDAQG